MIKQYSLVVTFLIICSNILLANNNQINLFNSANQFYEKGEYQEAIALYQKLIEQKYISDDLHYNLANCHFKTNQIAQAILHYNKALKINPSNIDAAYNLNLANQKTIDKIEGIPELFIYRWWKSIYNLFAADNWAKLSIIAFYMAVLCFSIFLFAKSIHLKKTAFYIASTILGFAFIFWILASRQNAYLQSKEYAVIMQSTVNILSAPSEGSSQLFVLHEGTKIKIIDQKESWMKISLPNGNVGWLLKNSLESI